MVRARLSLHRLLVLSALTLSGLAQAQSPPSVAAPTCEPWAARLISYQGTLSTRRISGFQQASVGLNETFCVGDVLEIGAFSRAALQLPDQTVVRLDQGTVVTFAAPKDDKRTWLEILKGAVHIISRDPRALRVITPFANAGIEGTEFLVQVSADSTTVLVFEGRVSVQNPGGAATAGSGESVLAKAGRAPVLQQVVRPRDAVVWTLYFPPTSAGPLPAADAEPTATQQTPDFYIGRAEQRLVVGQVTGAEADLNRALELAPGSGEVLARQSVIAVTRNQTAAASALADQAIAAAPASAAALLARSYARQATMDLSGAIGDLQAAAEAQPGSALVRARLAELWLATGDVRRSEVEAEAAVAAEPTLGLAHTILGFVRLTQIRLDEAAAIFDEAIRLQPNAPLPRLGLGLTKIRDGSLQAGREQIETAVILDPANSLLRSYMGKAYFDEKRDPLAASQFQLAKQLDPLDPTPWFYDAVRRQTTNDPVGALAAVVGSIERNDNRAVFRSRLLLDEDLAARSAAVGRIYKDLEFDELALRKGWQAVEADPRDHSGHRLLADSYASIPRYEVARVNELQQSQLLQPLNMTPIQPQLGDANLFILDTAGPSSVSFNEFNPLFSRNGLSAQSSAVVGGNGTFGADAVLAGIEDRFSFSLGGYHFETDGFRDNNDLEQNLVNTFFQYRLSPSTSLLAEGRFSHREQGDLRLYFDRDNFSSDLRQEEDTQSVRLGLRHDLSPQSTILIQTSYQWADLKTTFGTFFAQDADLDGLSAEVQYGFRADRWHAVVGIRYRDSDSTATTVSTVPLPDPPFEISITDVTRATPDLINAYTYAEIDVTDSLDLTLGVAYEELSATVVDKQRMYPKLGLRWTVNDTTELRAGTFRTLREFAFSRQDIALSLEPTQVAGFNQLFADTEGVDAWRYGIGIDHEFSESFMAGAVLSSADLDVPFLQQGPPPDFELLTVTKSAREYDARTYVYWAPTDFLAASVGYQYQKLKRDPPGIPYNVTEVTTNRVPFSVRVFSPTGFAAGVTATWLDQSGRFYDSTFNEFSGDTRICIVDAGVTYRLPNRWGLIGVEVKNLFDNQRDFQDIDPENPRVTPERLALFKITLAL